MRIAILGKGGRESALAWTLTRSTKVDEVLVFPGNAGMEKIKNVRVLPFVDQEQFLEQIKKYSVDYVVVGQEKYLEEGIIDFLLKHNVPCVGPNKMATLLEASKSFCKQAFLEADIPTAAYSHFTETSSLRKYCEKEIVLRPLVLKWDYLAEGKGVFVCYDRQDLENAYSAIDELANKQMRFSVLVEEFLEGEEFSVFYLVDQRSFKYFSSACDYKRLSAEKNSPNTGGMGAYSPNDKFENEKDVLDVYLERLLLHLEKKQITYNGVLFLGCIKKGDQLYLLEVNTRFGDPETQAILPRLESDLADVFAIMAKREGQMDNLDLQWTEAYSVHVVKADPNYPSSKRQYVEISEMPLDKTLAFFAGVKRGRNGLLTDGGRVLGLTALGSTKAEARQNVYAELDRVFFDNAYFRKDIGC